MDQRLATDEELVAQFKAAGDMQIINELYNRHAGVTRALLYQLVLNDADADDLTHEVFLRITRALAGFRGQARFSTWLFRVAVNSAKSFLARQSRSPVRSGELLPDPPAPVHDQPDRVLTGAEMDDRITAALAALSPKLRAAIVLTVLQEMGLPEAARIERCSVATLYWRVHQARKQLKQILEPCLK